MWRGSSLTSSFNTSQVLLQSWDTQRKPNPALHIEVFIPVSDGDYETNTYQVRKGLHAREKNRTEEEGGLD